MDEPLITLIYEYAFITSLAMSLIYAFMWHKHSGTHLTLIFTLIPVSNLGYVLLVSSTNLQSAMFANSMIYIGGCYLILLIMLNIFDLCHVTLPRLIPSALFLISSSIFMSVLLTDNLPIFYKTVSFQIENGVARITKTYGFMHTIFYIYIITCFIISVFTIIYTLKTERYVSRHMVSLLFLPLFLSFASFFMSKFLPNRFEPLPISFVIAQAVYLFIVDRLNLYDINNTSIDSLVETGDTGFVSFDLARRLLGSNETARKMVPALDKLTVDDNVFSTEETRNTFGKWIESFRGEGITNFNYSGGGREYVVNARYLTDRSRKRGYQFYITDDTANRQYIKLLDNYNNNLKIEVRKKTDSLEDMHNRLVIGMATMVESRDNSTGGHIKRTSEGVRLLIDEICRENELDLSDDFCRRIIKAAPMHDLGKIAVPDEILQKPGRFTPEEFEEMKKHAAEGAKIVHEILKGTDDEQFHFIAENVAHYHHERSDGSGYPDGLKGDQIPIEARIMAIADVYDALVSKRVYKDSMSFEEADRIIMEGMGTQFDSRLEKYYVAARPKLEAYYSKQK